MNQALTTIYTIFLGLISASFIGVGIRTFVRMPEFEQDIERGPGVEEWERDPAGSQRRSDVLLARTKEQTRVRQLAERRANGLIASLSVAFATLFMAISLGLSSRIGILADGIMLGGIFTLLYGVAISFACDRIPKFIVVTVSLGIALGLGAIKFLPHA